MSRLEEIQQRLNILNELDKKIDEILKLLEPKKGIEPDIQFTKANIEADMKEIKEYEQQLYKQLDEME